MIGQGTGGVGVTVNAASVVTANRTPLAGGTDKRVLFDDNGVVGEDSGLAYDKTLGVLTLGGKTVTTSNPPLSVTQTWNAGAVVFTGIKLNITDTASSGSSQIMDLQVGGVTKFSVSKVGSVATLGSIATYGASSGGGFYIITDTAPAVRFGASSDVVLSRDAAGILSLRGASNTTAAAASFYTYGASPPAAPAASIVRVYADTSGAKIRLMAIFPSGAAQQIAIEP